MDFSEDYILILTVDDEEEREVLGDLAEMSTSLKRYVEEEEEIAPKRVKRKHDKTETDLETIDESSSGDNCLQQAGEKPDIFQIIIEITRRKDEMNEKSRKENTLLKDVLINNALAVLKARRMKERANLN